MVHTMYNNYRTSSRVIAYFLPQLLSGVYDNLGTLHLVWLIVASLECATSFKSFVHPIVSVSIKPHFQHMAPLSSWRKTSHTLCFSVCNRILWYTAIQFVYYCCLSTHKSFGKVRPSPSMLCEHVALRLFFVKPLDADGIATIALVFQNMQ